MRFTKENIHHLYRLNNMVRYNPWSKINSETVASHSFYTSLFAMMLCDNLELGDEVKFRAIQLALVHDTPEAVINDITHDAKKLMPGLIDLIKPFEDNYIQAYFPSQFDIFHDDTEYESVKLCNNVAIIIVDLADVISVYQYCSNEIMLGNKAFESILEDTKVRIEKLKNKLEGCGISCQKITI